MYARLAALTIALLTAVAATLAVTSPAYAVAGSAACHVQPGPSGYTSSCGTGTAAFTYVVTFQVSGAAPGTSFTWGVSGASASSSYGCGSADSYCTKYIPSVQGDRVLSATVGLSLAGQTTYTYSDAFIPATCELGGWPVLC
ncbi:hypothetical protein Cs7R123_43850 [Catellatospora sp. TT07R-123]|uniref:hypothetical protein n=1 Tax=Catellatospora sp. TT07R-123 TaxID=2733863 RepID=UPI001B24BE86|nr:hypothetical protein [Catellatospora sp. TT07R-123]GHJ47043.1 hypothetical protein Cs7R123_43850 [Catellatospora sp. TT07R-123]